MSRTRMFFGPLLRRLPYDTKAGGGNYHYAHHRIAVAENCQRRCVYCDSHEDEVGGLESMEIDHFRPYGRAEFAHLRDEPENLVHSCGRCNGWKSDHWPTGNPNICYDANGGWIEPFQECRSDFFEVETNGAIRPIKPPAEYMIRMLRLDRELLRRLREKRRILADLPKIVEMLETKWRAIAEGRQPGDIRATAREALRLIELIKLLQKTAS